MIKLKILKNYKPTLKFILYITIITSIQTILNLIFNINNTINTFISLSLILIYILISNIKNGKNIKDKAYKYGFINGLITILTLFILSIITFSFSFNLKTIIYYLLIIFISILGSIIGINKKR